MVPAPSAGLGDGTGDGWGGNGPVWQALALPDPGHVASTPLRGSEPLPSLIFTQGLPFLHIPTHLSSARLQAAEEPQPRTDPGSLGSKAGAQSGTS